MNEIITSSNSPYTNTKIRYNEGRKYIPEDYQNVAKSMEKQFLKFMIEQMKKTTQLKKDDQGISMRYYKDLLTDKRSDIMSGHNGGLGIQDIILDQIYSHNRRNPQALKAYLQMRNAYFKKPNHISNVNIEKKNNENQIQINTSSGESL